MIDAIDVYLGADYLKSGLVRRSRRSCKRIEAKKTNAERRALAKKARTHRPQKDIDMRVFVNSLTNKVRREFMSWPRNSRETPMTAVMDGRRRRGQDPLTGKMEA